ncbi:hypothetical protein BDZ89DRAFT_1151848 [Hymenopellis radicata]|nr:hypothetical protein BDZ89DRAFT_1151848 [Hymenopellis radicata]
MRQRPLQKKVKSEREIGDMSLSVIAKAMREDDGVPIENNHWHCMQYQNSFTGFGWCRSSATPLLGRRAWNFLGRTLFLSSNWRVCCTIDTTVTVLAPAIRYFDARPVELSSDDTCTSEILF